MSTQTLVSRQELGERLYLLRFVRGHLSLRDVEEATGIKQSSLSRWERAAGKRYPDPQGLATLAAFYQITVTDLLSADYDTRVWLNRVA